MIKTIASYLPPRIICFLGRAQFYLPIIGPLIRKVGMQYIATKGVIAHGLGAGLKFDATGGYPGFLLGTTDLREQNLIDMHLHQGAVFYDIGANLGFYVIIAARIVGVEGRVYAFEPDMTSAQRIRENANANAFDNIEVVNTAVTDKSGVVRLKRGQHCSNNRIVNDLADNSFSVEAISIDDFCQNSKAAPPTLVLIDAEGAEIKVLRGMMTTIFNHRPQIMCEVHWLNQEFKEFYESELLPLGYKVTTYEGASLPVKVQRFHALLTCDS